jgi:hypothetical protein
MPSHGIEPDDVPASPAYQRIGRFSSTEAEKPKFRGEVLSIEDPKVSIGTHFATRQVLFKSIWAES